MAIFGIICIALTLIDILPNFLMWIHNWGEMTAWFIKIAFVVVGIVIYFMDNQDIIDDESNISS